MRLKSPEKNASAVAHQGNLTSRPSLTHRPHKQQHLGGGCPGQELQAGCHADGVFPAPRGGPGGSCDDGSDGADKNNNTAIASCGDGRAGSQSQGNPGGPHGGKNGSDSGSNSPDDNDNGNDNSEKGGLGTNVSSHGSDGQGGSGHGSVADGGQA